MLSQIVTGDFFGADRIDYLLRDAQCTGVSYGLFDYHQLIEMLCTLAFKGNLHLGIEENGMASCEALLLARHFMHKRVYQYSSVKAYKFHLGRFMKSWGQQSDALSCLENYLQWSDCEVLTAFRKASLDPLTQGHLDAQALLKREKRFKAVCVKEGIGEGDLKKIVVGLGIPDNAVHIELSPAAKPSQDLAFPVLTRSGAILPAQECSDISVPAHRMHWVYLSPEFEKAFRGAMEKWG